MTGPMPFIEYLDAVDEILGERYGITSHDADLEHIAAAQDEGDTPEEFVTWFAEHYDLQLIPTQQKEHT